MPMDEDIRDLETEPWKISAKAYDIVLNGVELGSGSERTINPIFRKKCLKYWALAKKKQTKDLAS